MNEQKDNNEPFPEDVEQMDKQEQITKKKHLVPALVALVVLLAIATGFLTYLLLTNDTDVSNNNVESNASQESEQSAEVMEKNKVPEEEASISAEWREFKSLEYKVKLPDGWAFVHQDNGVLIYSCSDSECYRVVEGSRATVEEVVGGRDGLQGLLVAIQPAGYSLEDITSGYTMEKELSNGFTLYKNVKTEEATFEAIGGELPIGTVDYIAAKTIEGGTVAYFGYSVLPDQTNPTNTIDEMIKTFVVI